MCAFSDRLASPAFILVNLLAAGCAQTADGLSVGAPPAPLTAETAPVVPFNSNFWSYWTHYWATWLPDHPVYEMIELTAYENPRDSSDVLVRVFLTERAGRKTQYFYLNDEAEVRRSRANSYFRAIDYRRSGPVDGPQSLQVSFVDKDDVPIRWTVRFGPEARLRDHGAGLTPSIHSVGSVLLFALRTRTIDTHEDRVEFGGVDYAHQGAADDHTGGTRSWFNPNYYSAVLIHGRATFTLADQGLTNNWGRTFRPATGGSGYRSQPLGPDNHVEFRTDANGGIRAYSHFSRDHSLDFTFDPAIPSFAHARDGAVVRFNVSFDRRRPLMNGRVTVRRPADDAMTLEWVPSGPAWAVGRNFLSELRLQATGYELVTRETAPHP